MYLISEAANQLNVSIHTLRYYEKEGLVPFVKRNTKGVRIYSDTDIQWIYMITCLRDIDMPINKIREYINLYMIGDSTILERRKIVYEYQLFVNEKINNLGKCLELINKKIEFYDKAVEELSTDVAKETFLDCSIYKEDWDELKGYRK